MNLATEPWIPVLLKNGRQREVSLADVFREGDQYADLAVRPHERIALMRLLVCVAQAALDGPADIDAWDEAPAKLPGVATRYLERLEERFELFHQEHPFLQILKLKQTGVPTPVTKLDFALATGNASTLFDHGASQPSVRSFSPARLALMLLTYLNFSPGGLIAQVEWKGVKTSKSSDDAPCIPGSMYHTFVRRADVRDSIHANTLTKQKVRDFYPKAGWGRPVWEQMPDSFSDTAAIANVTGSYLGRLVPLPRLVLLYQDCQTMLLGNGFKYPSYPVGPREPSATGIVVKEERKILGAGNREVWRELPALISKRHGEGLGGALVFQDLPDDASLDVYVGALLRKQADALDTIEAVLHVPAGMRSDRGRATYEKGVRHAEHLAGRLYGAVTTYYRSLGDDWDERLKREGDPRKRAALRKQLVSRATQQFWTGVEKLRPFLLAHIEALGTDGFEASGEAWRSAVHRAAREAYLLTCGQESARQMRAFALGWGRLFAPASGGPQPDESPEEDSSELNNQEA